MYGRDLTSEHVGKRVTLWSTYYYYNWIEALGKSIVIETPTQGRAGPKYHEREPVRIPSEKYFELED